MSLYAELKRRNVIRVAAAYVVTAWLIIQVVETIFPAFGFDDAAVRIATIILTIGLVPTLILAWAFELTPEGLKKDRDVDRTLPVSLQAGKKLDRIILIVLALALGYFAVDKFVLDPARDAHELATATQEARQEGRSEALVESYGDKSIAVLPFVNMSDDDSNEYFSDGISEELLNLLAQIPELRVISRSSSFLFKGEDISIPEVAKKLNVAHVLEGSVRKAGTRVRITAQLIEAHSDTHLWSESFDRQLDDIFAVQDEIAGAIGTALKMKLVPSAGETALTTPNRTANTTAYEDYLQGRELIHHRNREAMEGAVRHLERAVRLDDHFAPAHAQLAIAAMMLSGYAPTDRVGAQRKAVRHLDRAKALNPFLAEAHAGRALLAQYADEPEETIYHSRKALAANPSYVDAMNWLHNALRRLGRYEEAHVILKQMLATDPLSIIARINYAGWLMNRGRIAEAHDIADAMLEQNPKAGYRTHARISFWNEGKLADSLSWGLKASSKNWYASAAFTLAGEHDEARRITNDYWTDANEGRWDEAIQTSQRRVQLYPDSGVAIADAAEVLHRARLPEEALPLYERALALAPDGRAVRGGFGPYFTIQLAFLRRQVGDEEGAQEAASVARQEHAARRAAGEANAIHYQTEALIAAFDEEPNRAITALRSALQYGFRWRLFLEGPMFDQLQQEPGFVALREELYAILAVEHRKILQLICFNNPVPDEWQPMPETCEGVVEK